MALLTICGSIILKSIKTLNIVWTCGSSTLIKSALSSKLLTRVAVIGLRTLGLTHLTWHVLADLTSIVLAYFLLECGTFGFVAGSITFSGSYSYSFGYCFIAANFTNGQGNTLF